jgi:putative hydrolase of the HAD superfamily
MVAMAPEAKQQLPEAVLLDAFGTLVELDRPVARSLATRGIATRPQAVARALRAEIAYYRASHGDARDQPSLEALRDRCAEVFRKALGEPASSADAALVREALLEGLRFRVFDEVPGVLAQLRDAGARIVVVSNWDVSLAGVLEQTGLAGLVDAVLTSAEEGVSKPDPELFRRALALAGAVEPQRALHVGDDLDADVGGARAAGVPVVLLDRAGAFAAAPERGVRVARTLAEILQPGR